MTHTEDTEPNVDFSMNVAWLQDLAIDRFEQLVELLEKDDESPEAEERRLDLRESIHNLIMPANVVACRNFVARLMKACAHRLIRDDVPYLVELARMVVRLKPSPAVLETALAHLYEKSDGNPPKPRDVRAVIITTQLRVDALRDRIRSVKE